MTTTADIPISMEYYTELYSSSGIAVGTPLIIQNKTSGTMLVQNRTTQPSPTDWNGFIVPYLGVWYVEEGTEGVWCRGNGSVAVEVH